MGRHYEKTDFCRICGNTNLVEVLDLGEQMLTGVFPSSRSDNITSGPLRLIKCTGEEACGLVQLEHSYEIDEMYGNNYGYRSGLNPSMVAHLHAKIEKIHRQVNLCDSDIILDIGSNDSTTLQAYPENPAKLVGFDPTGIKFSNYYPEHIDLVSECFTSDVFQKTYPGKKAKIITSFSMFYDLERPMGFMRQVHDVLADDGIWVFEQSYLPAMLEKTSYDTVCHEHLEYYALKQIKWMVDRVGFSICDVEFNNINGGSFSVTVKKAGQENESEVVSKILENECITGIDDISIYEEFKRRAVMSKHVIKDFLQQAKDEGKRVAALGASTKGNVILQYCGVNDADIACIGEVNKDKYGSFTPGTWLPIVSEDELLESIPDYLIVLPWHFREFFVTNRKYSGMNLVFPLPELSIVKVP